MAATGAGRGGPAATRPLSSRREYLAASTLGLPPGGLDELNTIGGLVNSTIDYTDIIDRHLPSAPMDPPALIWTVHRRLRT